MGQRPLGRSYLVEVPSYDMSRVLTSLLGLYGGGGGGGGGGGFHGLNWLQSFMDWSNISGDDRTEHWSPEMDHPPYWAAAIW